jgi:hypothetical protein
LPGPDEPLPAIISALRFYTDVERRQARADAIPYTPAHELWSNGSDKSRFVVLPEGTTIDNADRSRWVFPAGTYFFKTFAFDGVPVETRVMRLASDGWHFEVYLWREGARDADRIALDEPLEIEVTLGGETFAHSVPSVRQCRACHESNASGPVIGFDELRLGASLFDLRASFAAAPPESPESIAGRSELEIRVLGYLHGNCAHCHNGVPGPNTAFDLRHPVAVENLVGRMTEGSGGTAGIRVAPRDPASSVVYAALAREIDDAMPPIGVQRTDTDALEDLRGWILSLPDP